MSDYQYYDFRAMDHALSEADRAELRSISTRAVITSTSFTNHYEWGDLKANPLKLLEKYFDAFLYLANWGTREFYLRFPLESTDLKVLKAMLHGEAVQARKTGRNVIVGFSRELEYDDQDDGTGWMGSLMALRSDLLRGDLRCLYLGWLLCTQCEEFARDEQEPAVPPGLRELSAPLQSLIEFLGIDEGVVEVAALASPPLNAGPSRRELDAWIRTLPQKEKDDLLVVAVSESGERWKLELLQRFRRQSTTLVPSNAVATPRRTVADLLDAANARAKERAKRAEVQRTKEAAQRKADGEASRARYLEQLAMHEHEAWNEVATLVLKRQATEYDKAVALVSDLRDIALRRGSMAAFQSVLDQLRQRHHAKESFLRRLAKAKL